MIRQDHQLIRWQQQFAIFISLIGIFGTAQYFGDLKLS